MQGQIGKRPTVPKYRRLIEILRSQIRDGKFPSGKLFPSENAWAAKSRMSRVTVRQAYAELEREGYLVRRQGKGTFAYMPPLPKSANGTDPDEIAILVPCVTISLFPCIIRGVANVCSANGYHLLIANYDEAPEKERRCIEKMIRKPVAGLVICPSYNSQGAAYRRMLDLRVPFVLADTRVDGIDADIVATDNFQASREGARRLIASGCRAIAFLSGHFSASTSRDRRAGFQAAMDEGGLKTDPRLILDGAFSEEFGFAAASRLLRKKGKVDGFFVANDPIAVGVVRAIQQAGVRVPEDVRICTFDEPDLRPKEHVPMIAIRQPRQETGLKAGEALLERIAERRAGIAPVSSRTMLLNADVADWV